MKVTVENFQSIKRAEIDVDGFTVITGPNNSGKTALMRAIRGAFQNAPGSAFIRHGEKECRVEVDLGDTSFTHGRRARSLLMRSMGRCCTPARTFLMRLPRRA